MADRQSVSTELSRDLSLFHVTMMGLGMMIGAGVFVGIGLSVQGAGTGGLLLTMALNGLIALFSAMSFAELSSAIPRAGGAYNFARIGFGRGPSFLAGWMEWLAASVAGGFYAVVFASFTVRYVNELLGLGLSPDHGQHVAIRVVAVCAAGLFIFINYRGSSETGKVGAIFTIGQMLFVGSIGVVGIVVAIADPGRLANFRPFLHPDGWWKLLGTMGVIYVAFEGFEVIAQAGDETVDPKRNIPKAMLYSVLIVTVTYVAVAFASVVAVKGVGDVRVWFSGFEEIEGFSKAVGRLIPGVGGLLVTLAVIFSATSALNATIYSATRCSYALGRDRMLPRLFARISAKRKTPHGALAFTSVIVLVVAVALGPKDAAATASITFLFLFFLVNLCVIRIRVHMGDELEYGFLMPLFPVIPLLAIVCQAGLAWGIFHESPLAWGIGVGWLVAGGGVYVLYARSHAATTAEEIHVFEERREHEGDQYQIMVAVANPNSALALVQTTAQICQAKDAQIQLLHMVPVPDQVPLSDAHQYMLEGKEGILEAMVSLGLQFPINTTLRYCRNPARGIVGAAREKRANLLILGWHGRARHRHFTLGSTVDPIVERSPCDVIVLKDCGGNRTFQRVLAPVAGGPNGPMAIEMAHILSDPDQGRITAFTVAGGRTPFDIETFAQEQRTRLDLPAGRLETKVAEAGNIVDTILAEAEGHDLVILGCTEEPLVRRVTRDPIPETVAKRCQTPLMMVRTSGRLRSWIRRWV